MKALLLRRLKGLILLPWEAGKLRLDLGLLLLLRGLLLEVLLLPGEVSKLRLQRTSAKSSRLGPQAARKPSLLERRLLLAILRLPRPGAVPAP